MNLQTNLKVVAQLAKKRDDANWCFRRFLNHRPDVCRSYPHLHKKEFVFRLMQAVENCSICPISFNVHERLKGELWHRPEDRFRET